MPHFSHSFYFLSLRFYCFHTIPRATSAIVGIFSSLLEHMAGHAAFSISSLKMAFALSMVCFLKFLILFCHSDQCSGRFHNTLAFYEAIYHCFCTFLIYFIRFLCFKRLMFARLLCSRPHCTHRSSIATASCLTSNAVALPPTTIIFAIYIL